MLFLAYSLSPLGLPTCLALAMYMSKIICQFIRTFGNQGGSGEPKMKGKTEYGFNHKDAKASMRVHEAEIDCPP
jgi:hypothetical protein